MVSQPNGDRTQSDLEISIQGVATRERDDDALDVSINTTRGELLGVLHPCEGEPAAVIYVAGALGGFDGPASGLYPRLAVALAGAEINGGLTGLRLHYRQPGEFEECVLDVLAGCSFLKAIGARRIALVGHSFGGGVVIKAGELSEQVCGVAALSSQLYGTRTVERLASKSLLLAHGTADGVLDCAASKDIFERAGEPKRLELYDGAGHSLTSVANEVYEMLLAWLLNVARTGGS